MKEIKVASIIDDYTVVINAGSDDGIKENDQFLIYSLGDEILDPDTRNNLGNVHLIKGKARIENIQEKISTIKSDKYRHTTREIKPSYNWGMLGATQIEGESIREPFDRSIDIGDIVKIINRKI